MAQVTLQTVEGLLCEYRKYVNNAVGGRTRCVSRRGAGFANVEYKANHAAARFSLARWNKSLLQGALLADSAATSTAAAPSVAAAAEQEAAVAGSDKGEDTEEIPMEIETSVPEQSAPASSAVLREPVVVPTLPDLPSPAEEVDMDATAGAASSAATTTGGVYLWWCRRATKCSGWVDVEQTSSQPTTTREQCIDSTVIDFRGINGR